MWKQKSYNELTTEEVNEILVQLKEIGIRSIGIAGGEPLLRKDLIEIVKKANNLKFDNIHIVTNGLLLTKERAENLIENGIRGIAISIDGTAEVNDYVRGIKGSYERSIKTLKMLTELRDSKYPNLNISIGTTLMKPTMDEIIKVINVAKELNITWGINLIDTSPYFFKGVDASELLVGDQNKLNELIDELHKIKIENTGLISSSHATIEYARKYFKDSKRMDIPCYLGYLKIYIGSHGEVYSGCWALPPLGNLRENTIKEIITSKKYKKRLYEMFLKKCPGCSCNYQTNLWYHFPSLCNEIKWYIRKR
jgi:MoaA/NifB/PqqE/SkfB family radical SAM enzyme